MADSEKMPTIWNVDMQVSLFHAMQDHKPVGIDRHFQMLLIYNKLNNCTGKKVSIKCIWDYLNTLYNITALNDSERQRNEKKVDFELPSEEYKDLIAKPFPRSSRPPPIKLSSSASSLQGLKSSVKASSSKSTPQISSSSSSSSLCDIKDPENKAEDTELSSVVSQLTQETSTPKTATTTPSASTTTTPSSQARGEGRKRTRQSFQNTLNHSDDYMTAPTSTGKRNRRI